MDTGYRVLSDYTKMKPGTRSIQRKRRRLEVCPKCGKVGLVGKVYSSGKEVIREFQIVTHKVEYNGIFEMSEGCTINVWQGETSLPFA